MIAIQIADFFLLKQDKSSRAVYVPNMIIWVIGFVVYRILMNVVSVLTPKLKKDRVDEIFACYDEKVTITKKRSLEQN